MAALRDRSPGVYAPEQLTPNRLASAKAVIFDASINPKTLTDIETTCLRNSVPFFYYRLPEHLSRSHVEAYKSIVLQFLDEQNQWKNVHPSPETIEKIEHETLIDIITTTNSHLKPEEVMDTVMTRIHDLIVCEAWSVLIVDHEADHTLGFAAAFGPGKEQLAGLKVPFGKGIAGWVAKHRHPLIVNNAQDDPRFLPKIDQDTQFVTKNILCAPLVSRGRTIGVIEMLNRPGGFSDADLELLQVLVNPAAVAIENAYLFQETQRLTIQDDLTKLFNSRHLNHLLQLELEAAKKEGRSLSLIFLDLDGFKAVNDNYGHLQGSQSLVEIAEIIQAATRESDTAGRYGGDEFMLILPDTDMEAAYKVAETIRDAIAAYKLKDINMSASIGLACYPLHGTSKERLIRLADRAMYRVKENGKNGIMTAQELSN